MQRLSKDGKRYRPPESQARYMESQNNYFLKKTYSIYDVPIKRVILDIKTLKSVGSHTVAKSGTGFYFKTYMFNLRELAKVLNVASANVRMWIKRNFLPRPTFLYQKIVNKGAVNYGYTLEEVLVIANCVQKIYNRRGRCSIRAPEHMSLCAELEEVRNKYRFGE